MNLTRPLSRVSSRRLASLCRFRFWEEQLQVSLPALGLFSLQCCCSLSPLPAPSSSLRSPFPHHLSAQSSVYTTPRSSLAVHPVAQQLSNLTTRTSSLA